jgi:hypothetical protein
MRAGIGFVAFALPLALVGACFSDGTSTEDAGSYFLYEAGVGHDAATKPDAEAGASADGAGNVDSSELDSTTSDSANVDDAEAAQDSAIDAPPPTYAQTVMSDHPLSYWRFGEASGTTANDSSGTTNGAYLGGYTLGATGAIANDSNTAASFDGTSGYVSMGAAFNFADLASMSIELWVKPAPADGNYRRVVSKETMDGNGREGFLMAYEGSNNLSFERFQSGAETAVGGSIAPNVYSYVVGTFDGTTMILYVNGAVVQSSPAPQAIASFTDSFAIATYSTQMAADCIHGTIDEVAVYDHALTLTRIQAHYRVGTGM